MVFYKATYMQLLKKYPDLDIKCKLLFDTYNYERGIDSPELFLLNGGRTLNFSHVVVLHVEPGLAPGVVELLEKTVNLKEIWLKMTSSKFHRTLKAIANLHHLNELRLEAEQEERKDGENEYKMSAGDYSTLRKVLSIRTLRTVHLDFGLIANHQEVYDCIIESTNNKLDELNVLFRKSDSLRGTFILTNFIDVAAQHQIYAGSLMAISIVDFVRKFSSIRPRSFEIASDSDCYGNKTNMVTHEWDAIQTEFIKSHPYREFTLKRITS